MVLDQRELREGARYRHRYSGALVEVTQLREDATVLWRALGDYHIEGHSWGVMNALEFLSNFDQIGADYRVDRRRAG